MRSGVVSGAYLEVRKDYVSKKPVLVGCAGSVVDMLREAHFPIDVSNNIWPPKAFIKAAGIEVKQTGSPDKTKTDSNPE
jgi:hypothetical protein